ncbi:MAG: hypothetical protein K8S94_04915 [Planctomycetia bacterium]|nr:hypothetical protein [Planctomycetia bacterium]
MVSTVTTTWTRRIPRRRPPSLVAIAFACFAMTCLSAAAQTQTTVMQVIYDPATGDVTIVSPLDESLTSFNLVSASGVFTGATMNVAPGAIGNFLNVDSNDNVAQFDTGFGTTALFPTPSFDLGNIASPALSLGFLQSDLTTIDYTIIGSETVFAGTVAVVPEPTTPLLAAAASLAFVLALRSRGRPV